MNTETKASPEQWLAVIGVVVGAFIAMLDISITNASLQDIQGTLSASLSEGSWISTSYLVTEIAIIPLTAFFTRVFSLRNYLLANVVAFLIFSAMCGFARNLPSMIIFRALQGLSGGALIPVAITVIVTYLPLTQQALGFVLFGVATTFAPSLGPFIGGWITANYGWPFIFFLNLIPGIPLIYLLMKNIKPDPMHIGELKNADYPGIISMTLFLGTFTTFLEEGNREDWLSSPFIVKLAVVSGLSLVYFLYREFTTAKPVVDLRLLGRRNFLMSCIGSFALGFALYSALFLTPVYLGSVLNYSALDTGRVMMWMGAPQLLFMPFMPALMKRVDPRILCAIGFAFLGGGMLMNANLTLDFGQVQFAWCQVVRALSIPLIITPSTALAYDRIEAEKVGDASGLFNMVRNLGGSIGVGLCATLSSNRYSLHFHRLAESFSYGDQASMLRLNSTAQALQAKGLDAATASQQAVQSIGGIMNREAWIQSYGDCFYVIAIATLVCILCFAFMNKPQGAPAAGAAH
jgi:DHA2 family multidrug resistance protein